MCLLDSGNEKIYGRRNVVLLFRYLKYIKVINISTDPIKRITKFVPIEIVPLYERSLMFLIIQLTNLN